MYCQKTTYALAKRAFDFFSSVVGLLLLSPLFLFVALWVKAESSGPVFFRQERVGKGEVNFRIFKFRTMTHTPTQKGLQITPSGDTRITKSGHFLRKYKIDEVPQLFNVFLGDMSLVGPRPEVPYYVSLYPQDKKEIIFSVRPGITDWASVQFKDEGDILQKAMNPQELYIEKIMPKKIDLACSYVKSASFLLDLSILFKTVSVVLNAKGESNV